MKAYFFCTFLGYDLYFFPQFFVLFWGDEPVATLPVQHVGFRNNNVIFSVRN